MIRKSVEALARLGFRCLCKGGTPKRLSSEAGLTRPPFRHGIVCLKLIWDAGALLFVG